MVVLPKLLLLKQRFKITWGIDKYSLVQQLVAVHFVTQVFGSLFCHSFFKYDICCHSYLQLQENTLLVKSSVNDGFWHDFFHPFKVVCTGSNERLLKQQVSVTQEQWNNTQSLFPVIVLQLTVNTIILNIYPTLFSKKRCHLVQFIRY